MRLRLDIDLMPLSYNRRNAKSLWRWIDLTIQTQHKYKHFINFLTLLYPGANTKNRHYSWLRIEKKNLLVWVGLLQKNIQEYVQKVRLCSSNRCFSYASLGPALSHSLNLISSFRNMAVFSNIVPKTSNFEQTAILSGFGYGCDRMLS